MKQLLRKTFVMDVLDKQIEFQQLSYYDAMEFDYMIRQEWFDIVKWFKQFMIEHWIEAEEIDELSIDEVNKMFKVYTDTALRGYYSNKQIKQSTGKVSYVPDTSFIVFISKELSIDPLTLIKEYTAEWLDALVEWIMWNLNEQTKEWRERNRQKAIWMDLKDVDTEIELEKLRAMRETKKAKTLQSNQ